MKSPSKRILGITLTLALSLGLLAGCGPAPAAPENDDTNDTGDTKTFLAHVTIDPAADTGAGPIALLADEVLMVSWDDEENIARYNLTENDMDDDYALVNEEELWTPYVTADGAAFSVWYSLDRMRIDQREVGLDEMRQYMAPRDDLEPRELLAKLTVSGGKVTNIEEEYVP